MGSFDEYLKKYDKQAGYSEGKGYKNYLEYEDLPTKAMNYAQKAVPYVQKQMQDMGDSVQKAIPYAQKQMQNIGNSINASISNMGNVTSQVVPQYQNKPTPAVQPKQTFVQPTNQYIPQYQVKTPQPPQAVQPALKVDANTVNNLFNNPLEMNQNPQATWGGAVKQVLPATAKNLSQAGYSLLGAGFDMGAENAAKAMEYVNEDIPSLALKSLNPLDPAAKQALLAKITGTEKQLVKSANAAYPELKKLNQWAKEKPTKDYEKWVNPNYEYTSAKDLLSPKALPIAAGVIAQQAPQITTAILTGGSSLPAQIGAVGGLSAIQSRDFTGLADDVTQKTGISPILAEREQQIAALQNAIANKQGSPFIADQNDVAFAQQQLNKAQNYNGINANDLSNINSAVANISGALDALPLVRGLRRTGATGALEKPLNKIIKDVVAGKPIKKNAVLKFGENVGKEAAEEFITGGGQEALSIAGEKAAGVNDAGFLENLARVGNAATLEGYGGGIGGGAFHLAGTKNRQQAYKDEAKQRDLINKLQNYKFAEGEVQQPTKIETIAPKIAAKQNKTTKQVTEQVTEPTAEESSVTDNNTFTSYPQAFKEMKKRGKGFTVINNNDGTYTVALTGKVTQNVQNNVKENVQAPAEKVETKNLDKYLAKDKGDFGTELKSAMAKIDSGEYTQEDFENLNSLVNEFENEAFDIQNGTKIVDELRNKYKDLPLEDLETYLNRTEQFSDGYNPITNQKEEVREVPKIEEQNQIADTSKMVEEPKTDNKYIKEYDVKDIYKIDKISQDVDVNTSDLQLKYEAVKTLANKYANEKNYSLANAYDDVASKMQTYLSAQESNTAKDNIVKEYRELGQKLINDKKVTLSDLDRIEKEVAGGKSTPTAEDYNKIIDRLKKINSEQNSAPQEKPKEQPKSKVEQLAPNIAAKQSEKLSKEEAINKTNRTLEENSKNSKLPKYTYTKDVSFNTIVTDGKYVSNGDFAMLVDEIRMVKNPKTQVGYAEIEKLIPTVETKPFAEGVEFYTNNKKKPTQFVALETQDGDKRYINKKYYDLVKNGATLEYIEGKPNSPLVVKKDGKTIGVIMPVQMRDTSDLTKIESQAPAKTETKEPVQEQAEVKQPETKVSKKVSQIAPKTAEKQKTAKESKSQKYEDYGEKIEGARKDIWQAYKEKFNRSLPETYEEFTSAKLSDLFPDIDGNKFIEAGGSEDTAAVIKLLRDSIPTKPSGSKAMRQYYRDNWTKKVQEYRDYTQKLLNGEMTADEAVDKLVYRDNMIDYQIRRKADAYRAVGYPACKNIKDYELNKGEVWTKDGGKQEKWSIVKGNRYINAFDTREEAVNYLKEIAGVKKTPAKKEAKLEIGRWNDERRTNGYIIYYKAGTGKYIELKNKFETAKDARDYLTEHKQELLEQLSKMKEEPPMRGEVNEPRVGKGFRKGKDVSPEEFSKTFGFRGVQFGNYVEGNKRVEDINNAYDSLMDMAEVLHLPEKAISLNGELGLAFGARGTGGKHAASAHYEPLNVVINLTKKKGAGSLAHEWWHSLDNYFGKKNKSEMATNAYNVNDPQFRQEMFNAYSDVKKAVREAIYSRSKKLDETRTKDYWSTDVEMTARAFETYIKHKIEKQGFSNDYLANIIGEKAYEDLGRAEAYPYPKKAEMDNIEKAFDNFFNTIKTRETDKGVELYQTGETSTQTAGQRTEEVKALTGIVYDKLGEVLNLSKEALAEKLNAGIVENAEVKTNEGKLTQEEQQKAFEAEYVDKKQIAEDEQKLEKGISLHLEGKLPSGKRIYFGKAPYILQDYGVPNLPMFMTQSKYDCSTHRKIVDGSIHNISDEVMKKFPSLLSDPLMIAYPTDESDYKGNSRIVVSLNAKDLDQKIINVVIDYDWAGQKVNIIPSAYGRENFSDYVKTCNKENKIIYTDRKNLLSHCEGVQFPKRSSKGSNNSITDKEDLFNPPKKLYQESEPTNSKEYDVELDNIAKKYFGTTTNLKEAGYILNDGSMLDLSGKNMGGRAGMRSLDHREVNSAFYENGREDIGMDEFMDNGAIRYMPESASFLIARMPSENQFNQLKNIIARKNGEVSLELVNNMENWGSDDSFAKDYDRFSKPEKILDDVRTFFNGGKISEFKKYYQNEQEPKGAYNPKQNVIEFFKNADTSTSVHEVAHWMLNTWQKLETESPEIARDLKSIRKFVGNKGGEFTTEQHEKFARGFEAYIRDGKAETPRLQKAFERFKKALQAIYKSLRDIVYKQKGKEKYFTEKDMDNINALFNRIFTTEKERRRMGLDKAKQTKAEKVKAEPKTQKEIESDIENTAKELEDVKPVKRSVLKDVGRTIEKAITPISTRLEKINPVLKYAIRKFEYKLGQAENNYASQAQPFLEKLKDLSKKNPRDYKVYDLALKNGNKEHIDYLNKKYGLTEEYKQLRELMDSIRQDAINSGMDVGLIEEYYPRRFTDAKKFLTEIGKHTQVESKLKEYTNLSDEDKAIKINNALKGIGGVISSNSSHTKSRKISELQAQANAYYKDSQVALGEYIADMNKRIQMRKFFGQDAQSVSQLRVKLRNKKNTLDEVKGRSAAQSKFKELNRLKYELSPLKVKLESYSKQEQTPEIKEEVAKLKDKIDWLEKQISWVNKTKDIVVHNVVKKRLREDIKAIVEDIKAKQNGNLEDSVGSYVKNLIDNKQITAEQENELKEILAARFNEKGMSESVAALKNAGLITSMGNGINSAITQIGDFAWTLYRNGFINSMVGLNAQLKDNGLTKQDLGIDKIAQEFETDSKSGKLVSDLFERVGLEFIDSLGKETFINGTLESLRQEARKPSEEFIDKLSKMFDNPEQVINDLKNGAVNDDIKYLLFNEISDFQPITNSEMPQSYLTAGNGRIVYTLKSYTIKQFDVLRRECFDKYKKAQNDYKNAKTKEDKAKAKENIKKSIVNTIKLVSLIVALNGGADAAKDFLLGRKFNFKDTLIDNILKLAFLNKFTTDKASKQGLWSMFVTSNFSIPQLAWLDDIGHDYKATMKAIDKNEDLGETIKDYKVWKNAPFVGKHYYNLFGGGAANKEKYEKQDDRAILQKEYMKPNNASGIMKAQRELQKKGYSAKDVKKMRDSASSSVKKRYKEKYVNAIERGDSRAIANISKELRNTSLSPADRSKIYSSARKKALENKRSK